MQAQHDLLVILARRAAGTITFREDLQALAVHARSLPRGAFSSEYRDTIHQLLDDIADVKTPASRKREDAG